MPVYEYYCPANDQSIELVHSMTERLSTWGEVCRMANHPCDPALASSPVERLLFAPGVCAPAGNSKLKELGFTKLVKRDTGVYENVTASGSESRYMNAGDPSTMPHISKKIAD